MLSQATNQQAKAEAEEEAKVEAKEVNGIHLGVPANSVQADINQSAAITLILDKEPRTSMKLRTTVSSLIRTSPTALL
jgi:hypothetical protein